MGCAEPNADVAKLVDALDLGSSAERRVGSTPIIRTICLISRGLASLAVCAWKAPAPPHRILVGRLRVEHRLAVHQPLDLRCPIARNRRQYAEGTHAHILLDRPPL